MGRSMIALFILSFLAVFVAFWTGVAGCWRRSPGNITATAIVMLFACKCVTKSKHVVPSKIIRFLKKKLVSNGKRKRKPRTDRPKCFILRIKLAILILHYHYN